MLPIATSIDKFLSGLQRGDALYVTEKGDWGRRCLISRLARKILGIFITIDDTITAAQQVGKYLSKSLVVVNKGEIQGIRKSRTWNGPDVNRLVNGVRQALQSRIHNEQQRVEQLTSQKESLEKAIAETQPEIKQLRHPDETTTTEIVKLKKSIRDYGRARHAAADLERARLSYEYATQSNTDLSTNRAKTEDITFLLDALKVWQRNQFPFVDYRCSKMTSNTIQKIVRACHFPEFVKAMKENVTLSDKFFDGVFRNMPPECIDAVDLFVLCPSIQKMMTQTFIDKRIQNVRTTSTPFQVSEVGRAEDGSIIRDVKLLFHNKLQSIVDPEKKITIADVNPKDAEKAQGDPEKLQALAKRTQMTVAEFFAKLNHQNDYFIDLEWFATGFEQESSLFPNLDLEKPEWWKQLPIFEKPLTRKEIEERFGVPFQTGHSLFVLCASRTTPDLNAQDTHASAVLLVPLDDGTFNLVQIGMFSDTFPNTFIQKFLHIFRSHRAAISLSDPNKIMTSRARIALACPPLDKKTFEAFMEKLSFDLKQARKGTYVFQAQGHNCAAYIRELIRFLYPHLGLEPFETPFEDIAVHPVLMPLLTVRKFFPSRGTWNVFRFLVGCLFGAWQTKYFPDGKGGLRPISLLRYRPWREGFLQLPAKFFETKKDIEQIIKESTVENNAQEVVPITSSLSSNPNPCGAQITPPPIMPECFQTGPTTAQPIAVM